MAVHSKTRHVKAVEELHRRLRICVSFPCFLPPPARSPLPPPFPVPTRFSCAVCSYEIKIAKSFRPFQESFNSTLLMKEARSHSTIRDALRRRRKLEILISRSEEELFGSFGVSNAEVVELTRCGTRSYLKQSRLRNSTTCDSP